MTSDWELLEAWRGGDQSAGDELVSRHFDAVCRFFRSKIGDDASDPIGQTFLACVEGRDRIAGTSFRGYLFGVARRRLADHFRKRAGAADLDFSVSSIDALAGDATSPRSAVAREQEAELLRAALRRLPVDDQIALELCYWEGLSGREISEALGLTENTTRSRLARARVKLREALAELAASPETADLAESQLVGDD